MDFNLTVTRHVEDRSVYHEKQELHYTPDTLLAKIKSEISQWNFDHEDDEELTFNIKKVKSQGETLGVNTSDNAQLEDRVG